MVEPRRSSVIGAVMRTLWDTLQVVPAFVTGKGDGGAMLGTQQPQPQSQQQQQQHEKVEQKHQRLQSVVVEKEEEETTTKTRVEGSPIHKTAHRVSELVVQLQQVLVGKEEEIVAKVQDVSIHSAMRVHRVRAEAAGQFGSMQRLTSSESRRGASDAQGLSTYGSDFDLGSAIDDGEEKWAIEEQESGHQRTSPEYVLKSEILQRYSAEVKTFVSKFVVLRRDGLSFFQDEETFTNQFIRNHANGEKKAISMEQVFFKDLVTPSGAACSPLPSFLGNLLYQHKSVFCLFTEVKSIVIAAPSRECMKSWTETINQAYTEFFEDYHRRLYQAMENTLTFLGGNDLYSMTEKIMKSKDAVSELVQLLDDQFQLESEKLAIFHCKQRAFETWKLFAKRRDHDKEMYYYNLCDHSPCEQQTNFSTPPEKLCNPKQRCQINRNLPLQHSNF